MCCAYVEGFQKVQMAQLVANLFDSHFVMLEAQYGGNSYCSVLNIPITNAPRTFRHAARGAVCACRTCFVRLCWQECVDLSVAVESDWPHPQSPSAVCCFAARV
jgi:hypothetical protein